MKALYQVFLSISIRIPLAPVGSTHASAISVVSILEYRYSNIGISKDTITRIYETKIRMQVHFINLHYGRRTFHPHSLTAYSIIIHPQINDIPEKTLHFWPDTAC